MRVNGAGIRWRYVLPALQVVALGVVSIVGPAALRLFVYLLNLPALLASVAVLISGSELAGVEIPDAMILWGTAVFAGPLWYALGRWVDRLTGSLPPREPPATELAMVGDVALLLVLGLLVYVARGATLNVSIGTQLQDMNLRNAVLGWLVACVMLVLVRLGRRVRARRRAAD